MKEKQTRPESYPRPTETDNQLKNQPEFIDQQPNDFSDKSVSNIPASDADRIGSDPNKDSQRGGE